MERTQNLPESAIAVEASSSLDDLVREDARKMLMTVRGAEVRAFIQVYSDERTQQGRRLVVRDGQLTPRQIMTGAGPLEVEQPLVRDRRGKGDPLAVRFISKVLPPYLKRSQPVTNICPWLYLKGIPTRGFQKALQSLVGADAADLSASTVSRLTRAWAEEHESWSHRDHRGKRSVCRLIRRNIVQPSSPGLRRITDPIQEHGSLAGHGRPSRMNQKDLTAALKKLGARDPERWARSQIEEGLPQLARYLFLRQAWRNIVKEDDPGWIEDSIERARTHPNEPYAGVGHALSKLRARGATDEEITDAVRGMQAKLLFSLCYLLDDPGDIESEVEDVAWVLAQVDPEGNVLGTIGGLHESVLETDPTGRGMRPKQGSAG